MVSTTEEEYSSPLLTGEIVWRDRYLMLESHGYRLRERYKPDWTPSWIGSKRSPFRHEDFHWRESDRVMDAVRISDNKKVFLKRVRSNSEEIKVHRFLSQPEKLEDPRNHTVPLLDVFTDDVEPQFTYLVLPLLQNYYEPGFYSVDEVVDFFRQLLEGIHYMHENGVAHRDCSVLNVMMDADALYPRGFHPAVSVYDASSSEVAYPKRRRDVGGVRYYLIDFGISWTFKAGEERKITGVIGQEQDVPELSEAEPYDPFLTDVFIVGNLIRKKFVKRYTNLDFLVPLLERMLEPNPRFRCTSAEAKSTLERIVSEQPRLALRWRLKKRSSGMITRFFQDVGTFRREHALTPKTSLASKYHAARQLLLKRSKIKQRD